MPLRTYRHRQLVSHELNAALRDLNMSEAELSRLTGARERTIAKWLDPNQDNAPHWLRLFLAFMGQEPIRDWAHKITDRHLLDEETYRDLRDTKEDRR